MAALLASIVATPANARSLPAAPADVAYSVRGEAVLIDVLRNDAGLGADLQVARVTRPGHGRASVEGERILYTPSAGFEGVDTMEYMVHARGGRPSVGQVTVHVARSGLRFGVEGRVLGGIAPGGTVTATVAGHRFEAVVDEAGHYALDVPALDARAMVSLDYRGLSLGGGAVHHVAQLGQANSLAVAAGGDGVLGIGDTRRVLLSSVSSAYHLLTTEAHGASIASDADLRQAAEHVEPAALLRYAALIDLAAGEAGEAETVTTPLQRIADAAMRDQFEQSLEAGVLDSAIRALRGMAASAYGYGAPIQRSEIALLFPSAPGTVRVGMRGQALIALDSVNSEHGEGRYFPDVFRLDDTMTWALEDGVLALNLRGPVVERTFPFNACGRQDERRSSLVAVRVSRYYDGDGVDVVDVENTYDVVVQDLVPDDECQPTEAARQRVSWPTLAFESGRGERPFTADDLNASLMLPSVSEEFGVGGTPAWGWRIIDLRRAEHEAGVSGGKLFFVNYGDSAGIVVRRYTHDGRLGHGVVAVAYRPDGSSAARFDLAVRQDPAVTFAADTMPGVYEGGFNLSDPAPAENNALFVRIRATGDPLPQGDYVTPVGREDGSFVPTAFAPFSWQLEPDGDWRADSYRQSIAPGMTPYCQVRVYGCHVARMRTWTPVARDGKRVYVGESLQMLNAGGSQTLNSVRANFYDIVP